MSKIFQGKDGTQLGSINLDYLDDAVFGIKITEVSILFTRSIQEFFMKYKTRQLPRAYTF